MLTEPYAREAAQRRERVADRKSNRPSSLRAYLKWASREYGLEPPAKLHHVAVMDAHGDPAMTGEAVAWLGFGQDGEQDWMALACRRDDDGYYLTPFRAALAKFVAAYPTVGPFVRAVIANEHDQDAVIAAHGHGREVGRFILAGALPRLWDLWAPAPARRSRVTWVDKSEAQQRAEGG